MFQVTRDAAAKKTTTPQRKAEPVTIRHFDPDQAKATKAAALEAADGDKDRLVTVDPYTVVIVNYPGFPTHRWDKPDWKQ
jgi:hypothetical protein